jgi:hypothetical protein
MAMDVLDVQQPQHVTDLDDEIGRATLVIVDSEYEHDVAPRANI